MKVNGDLLKGYASSLLSSLIYGSNTVAGRYVSNLVPSFFFASFRIFCGLLVLLPFAYKQLRTDIRPTKKDVLFFAMLGLIGIATPTITFLIGIKYSTATKASIFFAAGPAVTNLLLALFWRVKHSQRTWFGIICSFLGLLFVFNQGSFVNFQNLQWRIGDILLIINVVSASMFIILGQLAMTRFSPQSVTIYSLFFGCIFTAPYGIWQIASTGLHLSTSNWLIVLYMGFMTSGFAVLLNAIGIKYLGSGNAAILGNMMPLFGIIFGVILLKESLAYYHIIGIVMVFSGVTLSLYGSPGKKKLPVAHTRGISKNSVTNER